jgi:uncharacterized protein YndB with AHSA1/START domain
MKEPDMRYSSQLVLAFMLLLACMGSAQQNKAPDISTFHDNLPDKQYTAKIATTSYVAADGERVLRHELDIPAPLADVWTAMTTSEGIRGFIAPVTLVELKSGGCYCTNYTPGTKIGDPGTISNRVLSYIPQQMLSAKINLVDVFPPQPRAENTLFLVVEFSARDAHSTHVKASLLGFGTGEQWDKVYKFFDTGNAYTFGQLYKRFEVGPKKWPEQQAAQKRD